MPHSNVIKANKRRNRILNYLKRVKNSTVGEVADIMGVTERTVFRDIKWLRNNGHNIIGCAGRGGGIAWRKGVFKGMYMATMVMVLMLVMGCTQPTAKYPYRVQPEECMSLEELLNTECLYPGDIDYYLTQFAHCEEVDQWVDNATMCTEV